MDSRKAMLRRIVAFVSALSFVTVSNYTGIGVVAEEIQTQTTAAVETGENEMVATDAENNDAEGTNSETPDQDTPNNPAVNQGGSTADPGETTANPDGIMTTPDGITTTPGGSITNPSETTAPTESEPEVIETIEIEIPYYGIDGEKEKNTIGEKIKEDIKKLLGDKVKDVKYGNRDEGDKKIQIIQILYDKNKVGQEQITGLLKKHTIDVPYDNAGVYLVYKLDADGLAFDGDPTAYFEYPTKNLPHIKQIQVDNSLLVKSYNNIDYVKDGTPIKIETVEGYHIDDNGSKTNEISVTADGPIRIDNENKINVKNTYKGTIEENIINLKITTNNSLTIRYNNSWPIKDVEVMKLSELQKNQLTFYYNWDENVYYNGEKLNLNIGETKSVEQFLIMIGKNIDKTRPVSTFICNLTSTPDKMTAQYFYGDVSTPSETETLIEGQKIQLPYVVTKTVGSETKTYYLSKYEYTVDGATHESKEFGLETDFYENLYGGEYFDHSLGYTLGNKNIENLRVYYADVMNGGDDAETIKDAILHTKGNMDGKRTDNVYTIKKEYGLEKVLKLGAGELFEGKQLLVMNDRPSKTDRSGVKVISTEKEKEATDYTLTITQGDSQYLKFSVVYDNSTNPLVASSFKEPFYIFFDGTAPNISPIAPYYEGEPASDEPSEAPETKPYGETGWSNDTVNGKGAYKFSFDVSDDAVFTNEADALPEVKEDFEKIRRNDNLRSVASVTVGGYTFNRPDGGWDSIVQPLSRSDADLPYSISLAPQKEKVERDGKTEYEFNGKFNVILTLKTARTNYMGDIDVSAIDDCGNESAMQTVSVKIDTLAPVVNKIAIDGLLDGLDINKVLGKDNNMLVIKADVSDEVDGSLYYSGIDEVKFFYEEKEAAVQGKGDGEYSASLDVSDKDRNSVVKVVTKDKAGNEGVFYYSANGTNSSVTDNEDDATEIVTDNTPPEVPMLTVSDKEKPYSDGNNQAWYSDFPDINIKATDLGDPPSGLRSVTIRINGDTVTLDKDEDMAGFSFRKAIESGELYLHFVPNEANNQKFQAYLCYGTDELLIDKDFSLRDNGQLELDVLVTDCAGNVSGKHDNGQNKEGEWGKVSIFIDNNDPVINADAEFVIDNGFEVRQTKYGTFANHQIRVGVQISDTENNVPTSGYAKATLTYAGEYYDASDIINNVAYFNIPLDVPKDSAVEDDMRIVVTDNVGNRSVHTLLYSTERSDVVGIENIIPDVSAPVIQGDNLYRNEKGESWYSSDITVSYHVSDADSGLAAVTYEMFNDGMADPLAQTGGDYTGEMQKTMSDDYTLTTDTRRDGKYTFRLAAYDNAYNADDDVVDVYKDVTKPYISGFRFDNYGDVGNTVVMGGRFDYFYDDSTVLVVSARDDRGASAGIQTIYCVLYNPDGSVFKDYSTNVPALDNGVYSAGFIIPEGFKGDIEAWTTDNVKNTSERVSPDGFISENEQRHNSSASLEIVLPETEYKDPDGLPLYNRDVTARLAAADRFSGIKAIDWLTSDFSGWESAAVDRDGGITANGWNINTKERNIAIEAGRDITVSHDANGDFIRLKVTDNAGNTIENEAKFSIDKKAPVIHVAGLEKAEQTADGIVYYSGNLKAHITITERNFKAPEINGQTENGFTPDTTSLQNTDDYRHTMDMIYDKDGEYELDIECEDLAGNKAASYSSGKFVIDKTAPEREIHFYRNATQSTEVDPDQMPYINSAVNAVISVTEANFDPEDVTVTINGTNYAHKASDWETVTKRTTSTGSTGSTTGSTGSTTGSTGSSANAVEETIFTLKIPESVFNEDGVYSVAISGKDLAGNAFESYKTSFEIDTASPEIGMSGFASANKGDVAPVIEYTDINIAGQSVALYMNGELCKMEETEDAYRFAIGKDAYVTGRWETVTEGQKLRFVFDKFPEEEAYDGIYVLKATLEDKAANASAKTGNFSVNRYGSTFIIEEEETVNGRYLNEAPTVVITEINVDKHQDDSDVITIVDKGSSTVQLTDDDFNFPKEPDMLSDSSGYFYTYTIVSRNFEQDLDYKVTIQTVDAAGTQNISTNRGGDLGFVVDTHPPQYECDNLEANMEFRGSEMAFKLNANEKLQHVLVTSGSEVLLDESNESEDNSYHFTVPASNIARSITVKLTDLAGNESTKTIDNLLVTENVAVYLLHKTWFKVTSIASLVGIGALTGALAVFKRKKKNKFD